jgi:hypothetical protein
MKIPRWVITTIRNISDKSCRENQNTDFMFGIFFFSKIVPFLDNAENMLEPDRPQMTIQYTANALCIPDN